MSVSVERRTHARVYAAHMHVCTCRGMRACYVRAVCHRACVCHRTHMWCVHVCNMHLCASMRLYLLDGGHVYGVTEGSRLRKVMHHCRNAYFVNIPIYDE
eukprot:3279607-Pleurochrysis_carterae.AAC.1